VVLDRQKQVETVISSLGEHMQVTRNAKLEFATQLLAMAKLELQLSLYDIEQSELDVFCAALEHPMRADDVSTVDYRDEVEKRPSSRRRLVRNPRRVSRRGRA
jgi:Asp-tRNA(Asn)/Glu-tRNA(Gln) amidotransferase C subunit